jgi:hypothetical protein
MTKTVAILFLLLPGVAFAQTTPAQGPLVVERVHNPFVVAPDYKVTDLDGEFGQLAGFYAGKSFDDRVFLGGAGYWLANGSGGDELAYGGFLAGWAMPVGNRIRFGAKSLIGFGHATLGSSIDELRRLDGARGFTDGRGIGGRAGDIRSVTRFGAGGRSGGQPSVIRIRAADDFFVFEPQANVLTRLTDHIGLHWAGGYRLTAWTDILDDRVNGPIGSVALQLEW